MNYDKNSFLAGLATGMQLRGWHIGEGGEGGGGGGGSVTPPMAIGTVQALCIRKDIEAGELCRVEYDPHTALQKIGDRSKSGGGFLFVDDLNRSYSYESGKIVIRDALTNDVIDNSETAYSGALDASGTVMVFGMESVYHYNWINPWYSCNRFKAVFKDGSSCEFTIPGDSARTVRFGYLNGILAAAETGGSSSGFTPHTFSRDGTYLATLVRVSSGLYPGATQIFPISANHVGVLNQYVNWGTQIGHQSYIEVFSDRFESHGFLFEQYFPQSTQINDEPAYLGCSNSRVYVAVRLHDAETGNTYLDDYIAGYFNIASYSGIVELDRYTDSRTYSGPINEYGNLIRYRNGKYEVVHFPSLNVLYSEEIGNVTAPYYFGENDDYLYFNGIYLKNGYDWVMYASDTYPRSAAVLETMLGYAPAAVTLGDIGTAAILFIQDAGGD